MKEGVYEVSSCHEVSPTIKSTDLVIVIHFSVEHHEAHSKQDIKQSSDVVVEFTDPPEEVVDVDLLHKCRFPVSRCRTHKGALRYLSEKEVRLCFKGLQELHFLEGVYACLV